MTALSTNNPTEPLKDDAVADRQRIALTDIVFFGFMLGFMLAFYIWVFSRHVYQLL